MGAWVEFDATFTWLDGRVSSFDTGFTASKRQYAEVLGETGRLTLQDFCANKCVRVQRLMACYVVFKC